jgi:hypothetical protein
VNQFFSTLRLASWVKLLCFLVLMVFVVVRIRYAYESYQIRQHVKTGLQLAMAVKEIVEVNASKGLALDTGWAFSESSQEVVLGISPETGVITIAFGSKIVEGGRTLTLVPVLPGLDDGYALTGDANSSSYVLKELPIRWVCASANTITKKTTVIKHMGTLPSKYAPLECRW